MGVDRGFLKEGVETFEMEPMSPLDSKLLFFFFETRLKSWYLIVKIMRVNERQFLRVKDLKLAIDYDKKTGDYITHLLYYYRYNKHPSNIISFLYYYRGDNWCHLIALDSLFQNLMFILKNKEPLSQKMHLIILRWFEITKS